MVGPAVGACVLALLAPENATGPRPEYLALLRDYARGARAEAVAGLATWSARDLERQLGQLQRLVIAAERCRCLEPIEGVSLRAAVMLHMDRDIAEQPASAEAEQPRPCPGPQALLAARYAALLARLPEHQDFARRFFLAMALRCQWDYCLEEAARFGRDGLQIFPRDADLLLAVGSVYEEGAMLGMATSLTRITGLPRGQHDNIRVSAQARGKWMAEARRFLSAAVSAGPGNDLARLRLGRVLYQLGEMEPAGDALAGVVERSREPSLLFLAHLFLGRIHEAADRTGEAVADYRLALEIDPLSQSASVALAHALQRAGDGEHAREVLERAVAAAGRRAGRDAYWDYLLGDALHLEELVTRLREETLE